MKNVNVYTCDTHTKIVITDGTDFSNEIFMSHQFFPPQLARQFANAVMNISDAPGSSNQGQ